METNNDIKIVIQPNWARRFTDILIFELKADGIINYVYEDGLIKKEVLKTSEEEHNAKAFLSMPTVLAELLFKAIQETNSEKGIKTKDENLIEGKLLATEKHLEDMREMNKKMLDAIIYDPTKISR